MEARPRRVLDAMRRPRSSVCPERDVVPRMPVSREEDREAFLFECPDQLVDRRDYLVPACDRKSSARAKVLLYVDDDEGSLRFLTLVALDFPLDAGRRHGRERAGPLKTDSPWPPEAKHDAGRECPEILNGFVRKAK